MFRSVDPGCGPFGISDLPNRQSYAPFALRGGLRVVGGGGLLRFFVAAAAFAGEEAAVELGFQFGDELIGAEGAACAGGLAEAVEVAGKAEVEGQDFLPLVRAVAGAPLGAVEPGGRGFQAAVGAGAGPRIVDGASGDFGADRVQFWKNPETLWLSHFLLISSLSLIVLVVGWLRIRLQSEWVLRYKLGTPELRWRTAG